ncbi:MAG TPA: ABC transporter ATP-binding protein [Bacteroidetes bacterium]|nr:ABC transporter ATP-binding protein [Bacteroidota bacterium]HEX03581.1 ABC transporter ATP-binding protein [Bacteroidota bacterium]
MIETKSLCKRYGSFTAVDDLSFTIEAGQVLGFLGPNGAGKTTTMRMLTGFLTPTSGNTLINGMDVAENSVAVRKQIGYLPEGAPSYGEMTVQQFLAFIARARLINSREVPGSIAKAVEKLNLSTVLQQPIETLSKGFKRRVGLAQAIIHDPQILILDEPTDGLDPNQKHEVRHLIQDMAHDKIIVISTHILEEVEAVCNRVMIISDGKLLADDSPHGLIARSRYHNTVSMIVAGAKKVASALSELPEVARAELRDGELTLFPAGESGLFEAITAAISENQWEVSALRLEAGRLDEVFRSITCAEATS